MKIYGLFGILITFVIIMAIDWQNLKTAENARKVKTVYMSLVAVGITIAVLEMYGLIPRFDTIIIDYYKKIFGPG